jgi:hypothetical protein
MTQICRPWLLVLAIALGVIPEGVPAQQARGTSPRRPYGSAAPQGDLEQILKDSLERLQDMETLRDMLEKFGKHSDLFDNKDLRDRLQKGGIDFDPNDPKNKQWINDLLEKMGKDPDFQDRVKKKIPDFDPKQLDPKHLDRFKKLVEPEKKPELPPPNNGQNPGNVRPPPMPRPGMNPPPQPESDQDFTDTVRKWVDRAENWEGIGDLIKDSPTIKSAIQDLTQSFLKGEGGDGASWLDRFGNMADYAEKGSRMFGDAFGKLGDIPTPSLPNINLPSLPVGNMPSFKLPSFGTPSPGGGGGFGFGKVMLVFAAVLILGILVWQVWQRFAHPLVPVEVAPTWRLGAWPVAPGQVATRTDLIQAFEYLSLLLLGPAARTWNHLDIAAGMAGDGNTGSPEQRTAAHRLARLYEEARYTQGAEPLSSETQADARHNLCFLAGVAAA